MEIDISKSVDTDIVEFDEKIDLSGDLISDKEGEFISPAQVKGFYAVCNDDLIFKFTVTAKASFKCDRCLENADVTICESFDKTFKRSDAVLKNNGEFIDLTDCINECIVLGIPQKILCKQDCKGICQSCGVNLNKSKCKCKKNTTDKGDNPFSVLKDIKF